MKFEKIRAHLAPTACARLLQDREQDVARKISGVRDDDADEANSRSSFAAKTKRGV